MFQSNGQTVQGFSPVYYMCVPMEVYMLRDSLEELVPQISEECSLELG